MLRTCLVLACVVSASPAFAQDFRHEHQSWFGLFSSGPVVGDKLVGWFDAHGRFGVGPSQANLLLRPGVGYRVRKDMTVWLGYLWAPVWRDGVQTLDEHRVWQQFTWDLPFDSGARMQLRSRFEQRFAKGAVGFRFRQFVRAQTAPLGDSAFMLVAWDEVFIALNDAAFGQSAGFDQNRLFLGLARKLTPQLRIEVGYFQQYLLRQGPDPMRHVAMVNAFVGW